MLRHALRLLLALALGLAPALANADVYRWVDELGATHYTTDRDTVPRRYRGDAQVINAKPAARSTPRVTPSPAAAQPAAERPSAAVPAAVPVLAPISAPASAPTTEVTMPAATAAPVFPGPPTTPAIPPEDPRAAEVANLEAQIASDRERLRQIISTKRWESAELASDPNIREIAERLPRLQAELAALRAETVP